MTPNWDDPAVPAGTNPTPWSDRYSLALIFLRVCGAAHYPIQARQKQGEAMVIDVAVPSEARRAAGLGDGAPLWQLCQLGLGVARPEGRPPASAWVTVLASVLADLRADSVLDALAASLGARPAMRAAGSELVVAADRSGFDVTVRPVVGDDRPATWSVAATLPPVGEPGPADGPGWRAGPGSPGPGTFGPSGIGPGVAPRVTRPSTSWRASLRQAARWWVGVHRRMLQTLRQPGHRGRGVRRLLACVALDVALAICTLFVGAMAVSPFLGI